MMNRGSTPACVMAATSAGVAGPGATGRPSWAAMSARLRASMSSRLAPTAAPFTAGGVLRWAYDDERQPVANISAMMAHDQFGRFIFEYSFFNDAICRST